jgi:hypothetical protein
VAERKDAEELSELLKAQLEAKDGELGRLKKAAEEQAKKLHDSEEAFAHWRQFEQVELCQEYWLKGDAEAKQVVDILCAEKGIEWDWDRFKELEDQRDAEAEVGGTAGGSGAGPEGGPIPA